MNTEPSITYLHSQRVLIDGKLRPGTVGMDAANAVVSIEFTPVDLHSAANVQSTTDVLAPVPADIHFHGAGGVCVAPTGSPTDLHAALSSLSVPGYRYLATLPLPRPNASPAAIVEEVAAAAAAVRNEKQCLGLRLEGCFVSPLRAGIWPAESFCAPDRGLLDELVAASNGILRVIDVAPELPGALDLIAYAREQGLAVAVAHTTATYDQARAGFDAGATIATHLFNAMTGLHHREPGAVGAALEDPRVFLELIADDVHIHPAVTRLVTQLAADRVIAISDASPFAGLAPGEYEWAEHTLTSTGRSLESPDGTLAGSTQLLDVNLDRLLAAGMPLEQALSAICLRGMDAIHGRDARDLPVATGLAVGDRIWHLDTADLPL